ncbi:MAG: hypothetical protein WDO18_12435 [Acidobacteriota bacterium]
MDASLPYFLPVPVLPGTFGAFIRIRSAIVSKQILFDIGIAGTHLRLRRIDPAVDRRAYPSPM